MRLQRALQASHRWLALLIGTQLALWIASGVIMSWLSIEHVRGEHLATIEYPAELLATSYASPGGIIAQSDGVSEMRLKRWLGDVVYEVRSVDGVSLFDANTGVKLSPIEESKIRKVAEQDFVGDGEIVSIELLSNPPADYRGATPVWRAQFNDRDATRLYISPNSGEVISRRNRVWRIYDFFWMLHIMDYDDREDFNNPLVRAFSLTTLLFIITGVGLVLTRLMGGRYSRDSARLMGRKK